MLYGDSKLSKQLPTFTEGSKVHGKVKVDLTSGESINAVVVTIRGQLISGSTFDTFLDYSQTLWPESTGQKTTRGRSDCGPKDAPDLKFSNFLKLFWNAMPKPAYNTKIITPIGYIPIIRPGPPSRLRQLAYEETTPIPGPVADPEGWFSLPPCPVVGKLYNRQFVDATCTLSIALPLSYTRGSVIPLHLVIQSHDVRTLDVLSSPLAAVCRLRRTFRFHPEEHRTVDPKLRKDEIEHSELATWWPSDELPRPEKETFKRMLDGELLLPLT
ncbi:hypothetical protein BDP27DRAFT_1421388 [Rhodocollybia butyracea]|uniref:Arrestin-like N-terminal domain-containing protein n=1 Tax=Rhodocollybia butyracea TaxID=206335 RepID=A0A9P5U7M8_9AGAR|nr:hypothetical protein BDP27DRAFT_1421388 [Rhodocollybia butyracea]